MKIHSWVSNIFCLFLSKFCLQFFEFKVVQSNWKKKFHQICLHFQSTSGDWNKTKNVRQERKKEINGKQKINKKNLFFFIDSTLFISHSMIVYTIVMFRDLLRWPESVNKLNDFNNLFVTNERYNDNMPIWYSSTACEVFGVMHPF